MPAGVATRVDVNTTAGETSFDTGGNMLVATADYLQARRPGTYVVVGGIRWTDDSSGYRQIYLERSEVTDNVVTDTDVLAVNEIANASGGASGIGTQHQVVTIARLRADDRISLFARHGSVNANVGMARNLENSPELSMVRIGS